MANDDPLFLDKLIKDLLGSDPNQEPSLFEIADTLKQMGVLKTPDPEPEPEPEESVPTGILLSEVQPTKIRWLWKDRIPLGKLTTLDGDPGLGKSSVTLDLAARVSTGREMPDGTPGTAGGVVLISPEDGLSDTIQPRLQQAGADLSKITFLGTITDFDKKTHQVIERPFRFPKNLENLGEAIIRLRAKLLIIDPLVATLGKKGSYKDGEVRELLLPLQSLVEGLGVACIMVRHLTKAHASNALYRSSGSIAFIAIARSSLMVFKDPIDDDKRILVHVKSNLGPLATSLSFTIENSEVNGESRSVIQWLGKTTEALDELLHPPTVSTNKTIRAGRQQILRILQKKYPATMSGKDLAEEISEMGASNLRMTLKRMVDEGQILKGERGQYAASSPAPPSKPFITTGFTNPSQPITQTNG